jgi:hypothetical protein
VSLQTLAVVCGPNDEIRQALATRARGMHRSTFSKNSSTHTADASLPTVSRYACAKARRDSRVLPGLLRKK